MYHLDTYWNRQESSRAIEPFAAASDHLARGRTAASKARILLPESFALSELSVVPQGVRKPKSTGGAHIHAC